jgi:hypothetical protein
MALSALALCAAMGFRGEALAEEPKQQGAGAASSAPRSDLLERVQSARRKVDAVEAGAFAVQGYLRSARSAKDTPRAACLDDLLTRIHVMSRSARTLRDAIVDAWAVNDLAAADIELARLTHLGDRASRLRTQALRCGDGAEVLLWSSTTTVKVITPTLPEAGDFPRPSR